MRLFLFLNLFIFIWGCTTVEVTKGVIKVTDKVKNSVEEAFPKNKEIKSEKNESKEEEIKKEKKIIEDEQKKQKTIIETQQKLAEINFIGKTEDQLNSEIGKPNLSRSDGSVYVLRYDSSGCRLFLFFNNEIDNKRVEFFEIRNNLGELLSSKQSLEQCYREFKLIK